MPLSLLENIARLYKSRGSWPFLCIGPSPKADGSLDPQNNQTKKPKPRILQSSELYHCLLCSPIFAMRVTERNNDEGMITCQIEIQ